MSSHIGKVSTCIELIKFIRYIILYLRPKSAYVPSNEWKILGNSAIFEINVKVD